MAVPGTNGATYLAPGKIIGELRLTALDKLISHFLGVSIIVLTGSIFLASCIALLLTHSLHRGIVTALQSITDVVHDIRENRHFLAGFPKNISKSFTCLPRTLTVYWEKWRTGSSSFSQNATPAQFTARSVDRTR